jgi:hypothetical protein
MDTEDESMNKLRFLVGIATLFLTTGAAHASVLPVDFQCDSLRLQVQSFSVSKTYLISIENLKANDTVILKWKNGVPYLNGRQCKLWEKPE